MAQISTANLRTELDRMARHAAEAAGTPLASAIATGALYAATAPAAGGLAVANTDVLANMLASALAYNDQDQTEDLAPSISDLNRGSPTLNSFLASFWGARRLALDTHLGRYSANARLTTDLSYLDAALRVLNSSSITLRAHGLFAQYFGGLSPANVFTPTPYVIGTIAVTGAATATFTLTGKGGNTGLLDSTLYGPGQVALQNTKAEGLVSSTITLTCLSSGVGTNISFTVGTVTNNQLTAGSVVTQTITGVTAFVSISGGVNADTFNVVILPDRAVSGA